MSRIIECHVNDEYILGSGVPIGAAGSFGDVILKLSFNEMWDGLSIVATFKDALGQNERVVMLLPSMLEYGETRTYLVPVPKDAKALAGRAKLTLSGYSTYTIDEDGTKTVKNDSLTNTATAFFRVLESDSAIIDNDSVDAPLAVQVQEELVAFGELMTELKDEMDEWDDALDKAENGYVDEEGNPVPGRVGAEEIRVENEKNRMAKDAERDGKIAKIETLVGDIDTALDSILAIQESLIGGGA